MIVPAYWILMAMAALMVAWRPATVLGWAVIAYAFEGWLQSRSTYFVSHTSLHNLVTGLLIVLAVGVQFLKKQRQASAGETNATVWILLALFVWSALSTIWSIDRGETIAMWRSTLIYNATFIALLPLVLYDLRDVRDGLFTSLWLGAGCCALMLFAAPWMGRGLELAAPIGEDRITNPLEIATLGGAVLLLAVTLRPTGAATALRIAQWALVPLALAVMIQSGSRGQFFGSIVLGIAFFPMSRRVRDVPRFLGVAVGLAVLMGVGWFVVKEVGLGSRFESREMADVVLATRGRYALDLGSAWLGAGPFYWVVGLGTSSAAAVTDASYIHNVPLEVTFELGLVGAGLFAAFVVATFAYSRRLWHLSRSFEDARGVTAALLALTLFYAVLSLKQGSMLGSPMLFAFGLIVARSSLRAQAASSASSAAYALHDQGYVGRLTAMPRSPR